MHQTRGGLPSLQGHAQRLERQLVFQRAVQRPADHPPGEGIQNHREIDELPQQPDVGNIGYPELVQARQGHPARQVGIDRQIMLGVRGDHELAFPQAQ